MKRIVLISISLVLMVGGVWFARAVWRAHKNIVSLDVRNMPLKDVIRKIEWQTWEKIQMDKRLNGNVTLQLNNVPLAEALDRVAEEVGARAQTFYAVHRADYALKRLQAALKDGEKIDTAGWTNLSPNQATTSLVDAFSLKSGTNHFGDAMAGGNSMDFKMDLSNVPEGNSEKAIKDQLAAHGLDKIIPASAIAEAMKKAAVGGSITGTGTHKVRTMKMTLGPDGKFKPSDGHEISPEELQSSVAYAMKHGGFQMATSPPIVTMTTNTATTVHMTTTAPDGTIEEVDPEILSPERIVIETALDKHFTNDLPIQPTRTAAEQAARKVKGRCTTLYALEKSDLPPGIGRALKGLSGETLLSGSDGMSPNPAALADRLEQVMQRQEAEQYQKLTPEQRARRNRELRPISTP